MKNIFLAFIILSVSLIRCSSGNPGISEPAGQHPESSEVVHEDEGTALNEHEHSSDTSGYSIITLNRRPFAFTIRTGGIILSDNKDMMLVTAKSPGLVRFSEFPLFPGVKVSRGQVLFTISGNQLTEDNSELRYRQLKSDVEKASRNYERVKNLISDKLITEEHFLEVKNEYEKILSEFETLGETHSEKGNSVFSPGTGYIREIFVGEGQKVSTGEALASIMAERKLILKADVSPGNLDILPLVKKANFKVGYSNKLFKTDEMSGRKIAHGKSTGGNSFYIPVYFSIDYDPGLLEGSFAEVFLKGELTEEQIVVPNTALLEEFGKVYVFVAHEDGDFEKRYITPGQSDGENTVALGGLSENERIVSEGALMVRLSQMPAAAPVHNH